MSSSLAIKSLLGITGATATAGLGILAVKGLPFSREKVSISSLLNNEPSRRLIADSETAYWTSAWTSYKNSGKDIWGLGQGETSDALKTACRNKLDLKVENKNSEEYQSYLNYCSRYTLVSDLISENNPNKEQISKGDGNSQEWKKAWKSYVDDQRTSKTDGGDGIWKLGDWKDHHSKDTAPTSFMDKCETNFKTPFYDLKGGLYLDTAAFCTKDKVTGVSG
ncbi:hypothetical protein MHC_04665 [Mycoplasma haemocanis str. Illinois]|uniref:Uncharacterized protein n=1 Tax=Mycoplasma haemocanis (strain Illinois) TaxID=1111676 RepID=H6N817_MYCHN|nr:hypothetical protein [Mycoplasma haemocanis]AEW45789.1 hypothetical protein MHC_04665 [Mycoplasma haemocanis str. Illinois]